MAPPPQVDGVGISEKGAPSCPPKGEKIGIEKGDVIVIEGLEGLI
jgi:hypothetical protein